MIRNKKASHHRYGAQQVWTLKVDPMPKNNNNSLSIQVGKKRRPLPLSNDLCPPHPFFEKSLPRLNESASNGRCFDFSPFFLFLRAPDAEKSVRAPLTGWASVWEPKRRHSQDGPKKKIKQEASKEQPVVRHRNTWTSPDIQPPHLTSGCFQSTPTVSIRLHSVFLFIMIFKSSTNI